MKKRTVIIAGLLLLLALSIVGWGTITNVASAVVAYFGSEDADMPRALATGMSEEEYFARRAEYNMWRLGETKGLVYDPLVRESAIKQMRSQEAKVQNDIKLGKLAPEVGGSWSPMGPSPIPNGQTSTRTDPVSGRTVAIVVHPTNPNIVYVGAAQGGVYRSTDGGTTWTQLFNGADSQVIGALALAPSNPEILYVGTGEPGQCGSGCYAGIGMYRIDNASTSATLTGPINPIRNFNDASNNPQSGGIFTGRTISEILVNPTDPSIVFVSTASGIVGNVQQAPQGNTVPPLGIRGLYRLANATGSPAGVTATKLTVSATNCFDTPCTGNLSILDMVYDKSDASGNTIVVWLRPTTGTEGGVYRTTNALTTATFTNTLSQTATANSRGELTSVVPTGGALAGQSVMYLANGESSTGRVRQSVNGGATWSAALLGASAFCGGQCFYDIAVDVDPTDANIAYVAGATGTNIFRRTTDGFATVANTPSSTTGLHADAHVIAVAPSSPSTIYFGCDGGIWKSTDSGTNWTALNNSTYSATQFQSLATHPTDPFFTIGGTQDNGTQFLRPDNTWIRADFGDGGYARIDQTAVDTTNVVMYHTYFNQTNAQGIGRVLNTATATDNGWTLLGCGFAGSVPNGFNCTTTTAVLFYAPFELGPIGVVGSVGQPVYWGADALYRSVNQAATFVPASQQPIVSGQPITTIAVASSDDNYRLVGLNNGQIWGTTTGASPLVNISPAGGPARAVGKIVIDPNNKNAALAGFGGQGITGQQHIWKTSNLNAPTPTWTAVGNGLPDTPVNALLIDPINSSFVYAGTDVGVYVSVDAGINWVPYGTGLPKIAVFEMAVAPGASPRQLRIATHGRGIWQTAMLIPSAASVSVSGRVMSSAGTGIRGATVRMTGGDGQTVTAITNAFGYYKFDEVISGRTYMMAATARGYTFQPRAVQVSDQLTDVDFTSGGGSSAPAKAGPSRMLSKMDGE